MDHCEAQGVDRISALPDDLLHVILGRLEYAPAVAKTAVLSRRWRHVWPLAKRLRFEEGDKYLKRKRHFQDYVDWVLAQRGDAELESLKILCSCSHKKRILFFEKGRVSSEKVNEWLRYAARCVVGSVDIDLGLSPDDESDHHHHVAAVELPIHGGRTTSISLDLASRSLRLPAMARYKALTELMLRSVRFQDEGDVPASAGSTLSDFVTSCCPRLRRLIISDATGLIHLVLRSEVLQELSITSCTPDLQTLDVMAPDLRIFHLYLYHEPHNKVATRIVAPRLEEIHGNFPNRALEMDIHGLKSVRVLKHQWLALDGKYHHVADDCIWLLENCPGVQHLDVIVTDCFLFPCVAIMDIESESNAPFANLRTMDISSNLPKHQFVASISSLLMRCPNLTSIAMDIYFPVPNSFDSLCEALTDRRKIHGKLQLESLQEVKITDFSGTDEEMQLVSLLFGSSNSIKRLHVELCVPVKKKRRIATEAAEKIFHQLTIKIPSAHQGRLIFPKKPKWKELKEQTFTAICDWTWL